MINPKTSATFYTLILGLLILFSFLTFSEQYYPLLNPDMALNVMMTPGYTMPGDLYNWGQHHNGSLIPMLAHLLCIIYFFPPLLAVSVIHFLILIAGYWALSRLFKDRSLKLALALVWFFPSWHFLDHVLLAYGVQMSFIAFCIYFINRAFASYSSRLNLLWLSLASFSFIASVWISDLAVLALVPFSIGMAITDRDLYSGIYKAVAFKDRQKTIHLAVTTVLLVIGTLAILYARRRSVSIERIGTQILSSPWEINATIKKTAGTLAGLLTFRSGNILESIYLWSVVSGIPFILFLTRKKNDALLPFTQQRWLVFFLLNGIMALITVGLSHYIFSSGSVRHYFSIIYVSFWIALLLFLQRNGSPQRQLRTSILFIIIVVGSLSSFIGFYIPERIEPKAERISGIRTLGNCGIIASYPVAYLAAVTDPGRIKTTPHDSELIRNSYMTEEVFRQPKVYLAKDGWLAGFPDTIRQFGHLLMKEGREFQMGGYSLCRYIPQVYHRELVWKEMQYRGKVEYDADAWTGQSVKIDPGFDHSKHFIYGPFIKLAPGKLVVKFRLKSPDNLSTDKAAFLDVSADFGKTILGSKTIQFCDFERANAFQEFEVPIELNRTFDGMEFRVLYLGAGELSFDRVTIQGF